MRLYLDTEFNGFGGELISLALCGRGVEPFYEVVQQSSPTLPNFWVLEHVAPVLNKKSITQDMFRVKFHSYLLQFDKPEIIADWHDDIAHFCKQLNGTNYGSSLNYPCTFWLISTVGIEIKPKVPHNALSDAEALMEWFENSSAGHKLYDELTHR